jgi:hypothetical protein
MDVALSPERQQMTASNNLNEQIREYYQQAMAVRGEPMLKTIQK